MQNRRNDATEMLDPALHPLKSLTPEQFAALGGTAVVFVRTIEGGDLAEFVESDQIEADEDYQLVMSADGSPLFVSDTAESIAEWLSDKNFGLVALH